ncbi:MAG: carboxypeptidase-like regulatory domain-containing protein [Pedobacter sp.]|nr:carboxypeptidase-like regulatory domain-containing protein [Pedobacter sp.]MDQ8051529.1 carboxypeptidase-like regulatory domain-containing protein [Pedobacter sp.]
MMNLKLKLLAYFWLLLALPLWADAQSIGGKVVDDKTGEGVSYVSIGIVGSNEATITNENGEFVLKTTNFPITIRLSHISYQQTEFKVSQQDKNLELHLKQANNILKEVVIEPDKGLRILSAALKKAKEAAGKYVYANSFYRQLTTINGQPSEIYELFYDLKWSSESVKGWSAKQSRFATSIDNNQFSINNQSFLTFIFSGMQPPLQSDNGIRLNNLKHFNISIERYIEQDEQDIAVITCHLKRPILGELNISSTFYIGTKNFFIYRLENEASNLPFYLSGVIFRRPTLLSTISTFRDVGDNIPVLETIVMQVNVFVSTGKKNFDLAASSLLNVYHIDPALKSKRFKSLNADVEDKKVIKSIHYDQEFWKDNPIVKQTALEDSFIRMMEGKSAFGTMVNP